MAAKASIMPQSGQMYVLLSRRESAGGAVYRCPQMGQVRVIFSLMVLFILSALPSSGRVGRPPATGLRPVSAKYFSILISKYYKFKALINLIVNSSVVPVCLQIVLCCGCPTVPLSRSGDREDIAAEAAPEGATSAGRNRSSLDHFPVPAL